MVDGEKVILMTKMASYASRQGKKDEEINQFFRGDYIEFHVVSSIISATIVFGLVVALYAIYHFGDLLQTFYTGGGVAEGMRFLLGYFVLVIVYSVISYIVYSHRYKRMRKELRSYYNQLKKLEKMNEK